MKIIFIFLPIFFQAVEEVQEGVPDASQCITKWTYKCWDNCNRSFILPTDRLLLPVEKKKESSVFFSYPPGLNLSNIKKRLSQRDKILITDMQNFMP